MQNDDAQKAKLFEAVRRVDRAEQELREARAQYDVIYRDIAGHAVVLQAKKPLANGTPERPPTERIVKVGTGHRTLKKLILEFFATHPGEHGHKQIAEALEASRATTRFTLWELVKEQQVEKSGIDRYRQLAAPNGAIKHDSI